MAWVRGYCDVYSLFDMLRTDGDVPPGTLHELSEMCVPIAHLPKALPVVSTYCDAW